MSRIFLTLGNVITFESSDLVPTCFSYSRNICCSQEPFPTSCLLVIVKALFRVTYVTISHRPTLIFFSILNKFLRVPFSIDPQFSVNTGLVK